MPKLAAVPNDITVKIGAFPGGKVNSFNFSPGTSIEDGLRRAEIGGRDPSGLDVRVNGKPASNLKVAMEHNDQILVFSKVRGNLT